MCQYTSVAEVARQVFGDGGDAAEERTDITAGAATFEQAVGMINSMLTM